MARVMVTIPDELLAAVDRTAQHEHRNRSELLREALRHYLRQPPPPVKKHTTKQAIGVIERLRTKALQQAQQAQNSTDIIRAFRGPLDVVPESTNHTE